MDDPETDAGKTNIAIIHLIIHMCASGNNADGPFIALRVVLFR